MKSYEIRIETEQRNRRAARYICNVIDRRRGFRLWCFNFFRRWFRW